MSNHADQIAFVERRDGLDKAREYAAQCLQAWRKVARPSAAGKKQFAHALPFRPHFVRSILYVRSYLRKVS